MFLTRNRRTPVRRQVSLTPALDECEAGMLADPQAQAELVRRALTHLEQVQQLVQTLDEVPGGDRLGLLAELATTADSLRQLYFVDAIY